MARNDGDDGGRSCARGPWAEEARRALAELLATALLVMLGCMSLLPDAAGRPQPLAHPALAFGFLVLALVQAFGGVSGAHMNPAVTLAALVAGECGPLRAALYAAAQCLGGVLGFGALIAVAPHYRNDTGMDTVAALAHACPAPTRVTPLQATLVEATLTLVLGLLCCAVWRPAGAPTPPPPDPAVPVKFGLTVAGLVYVGGLLSGASLNPARSLGPALLTGQWTAHWVYWVGPLSGTALAALLYRYVLVPPPPARGPRPAREPQDLLLQKRDP